MADSKSEMTGNDGAKEGERRSKPSLQGAFLDWKARQGRRAQPKALKDSNGGGGSKQRQSKARVDDDDSDAKPTQKKAAGAACADDAKPTPLVPFVADAYVKKDRGLLDRCVEFYTNDPDLRQELEQLFLADAQTVPPIDMKKIGEGEYPVDAHAAYLAYVAVIEEKVAAFLAAEGGSFDDLHALAKDESDVAYSDAWMFVTLFSSCTTFFFYADMVKQAQEGDLNFSTTLGLNPKYNV
jgi:hypothetical protein